MMFFSRCVFVDVFVFPVYLRVCVCAGISNSPAGIAAFGGRDGLQAELS